MGRGGGDRRLAVMGRRGPEEPWRPLPLPPQSGLDLTTAAVVVFPGFSYGRDRKF
jgi:hypothetical protein